MDHSDKPDARADHRGDRGHYRTGTMIATTAFCVTAALTINAFGQSITRGYYVDAQASCETAPGVAGLSFDGKAFGYKKVLCTLDQSSRNEDTYKVVCIEDNDPTTKEEQTWRFKQLSATSFSINNTTYRLCEEDK